MTGIAEARFTEKGILQFINTFWDGRVTNATDIAEQLHIAGVQTPDTKAPIRDLLFLSATMLVNRHGKDEITKEQLAAVLIDASKKDKAKADAAGAAAPPPVDGEEEEEEHMDVDDADDEGGAPREPGPANRMYRDLIEA
eukprot:gene4222-7984_t